MLHGFSPKDRLVAKAMAKTPQLTELPCCWTGMTLTNSSADSQNENAAICLAISVKTFPLRQDVI